MSPDTRRTLSPESWSAAHEVSTASLTSQLLSRGFRNTFLRGLHPHRPDLRMVGYALTLRYVPAREDVGMEVHYDNKTNVQRIAVEAVRKDDVLVIDARGETRSASFGQIIATRVERLGGAGIVSDGAFRDTPGFRRLGIPTYSQGAHATTSSVIHHPADMNVPIGCAGVLVMPGDVLIGDAEGVVVIPQAHAPDVIRDALKQDRLEEFLLKEIAAGAALDGTYPPNEATLERFAGQGGEPG